MRVICFSDVHLLLKDNKKEKEKLKRILSFLAYLNSIKLDKIIIAGDLFDVWYEYKMVIPKHYFSVLQKLKILSDKGTRIVYIAGNHDFKFIDFMQKELKAKIYQKCYTISIGKNNFFISHGDIYTTNDARYHIFRKVLRNNFINWLFGKIHPDIGLKIGNLMSRSSRKAQKPKSKIEKLEKGLIQFAQKKFKDGFNYVVMGHVHNPQIIELENGKYINLGDWIKYYSYLKIEDEKVELKFWQ